MAFTCMMNNEKIYSFHYSPAAWIDLKSRKKVNAFTMSCCGEAAVLKTSALGTQFFAHKIKSEKCPITDDETKEHLFAKYLVSRTLHEMGWQVEPEKRGVTPDGTQWVADVYAEKGNAKMAVEIQWSPQIYEDTVARQQIYMDAGIRCVWLLRDAKSSNANALTGDYRFRTKDTPVFTLVKRKDGSMHVHNIYVEDSTKNNLNTRFKPVSLELTVFIKTLFGGDFRFIPRKNDFHQFMSLELAKGNCWKCHNATVSVGRVYYHENLFGLSVKDPEARTIREIPQAHVDFINQYFQPVFNFARLSMRFSKTEQDSYMANSCLYCNALLGKFFEEHRYYEFDVIETQLCDIPCGTIEHENPMPVGQWIINNPALIESEADPLNYFVDFDPAKKTLSSDHANDEEDEDDEDDEIIDNDLLTFHSLETHIDVKNAINKMFRVDGLWI